MYSVLLIDADPIRAFDLYIRLEDEGLKVLGPVSSASEGFTLLKNEALDGIIIHAETARQYFPELYAVVMEADTPVIFLESKPKAVSNGPANNFIYNLAAPIEHIKTYLGSQSANAVENNYMIPESTMGEKIHI